MTSSHKRHSECHGCGEDKPLLMPVEIYPGMLVRVTLFLCLSCRVNWRDDQWACLATTIDHGRSCAAIREDQCSL